MANDVIRLEPTALIPTKRNRDRQRAGFGGDCLEFAAR